METTQRTPRRRIALVALILIAAVAATTNVHADETKWLLAPPTNANTGTTANNHGRPEKLTDSNSSHKMLRTVGSSLAIVLGTFLLVSTFFRKPTQQRQTNNMLETLGAIQVTPRVKLHLVRFGERLLVLHLAPGTVQRVAEIADPAEVQRLLGTNPAEFAPVAARAPAVDDLLRSIERTGSSIDSTRGLVA